MTNNPPIVRQISWLGAVPQFLALALAVFIASRVSPQNGMIWGAAVYLVYSFGSRSIISRDHKAGIALVKDGRFKEAVPRFQKSLTFFDKFPWIDKGRSIFLMSASAVSFREMAMINIAFCYSQTGQGTLAKAKYEECLERFPDCGAAIAALRMMDSLENNDE